MVPGHHRRVRAALVVREQFPDIAVLVLSQYVEENYATELVAGRSRGVGYLLKDRVADVSEFVEALRRVAAGGTALDPEVVSQLLSRSRRRDPLERLTPREVEVLRLMAEGRSNTAIAATLVVTDIEAARQELIGRGLSVSPIRHKACTDWQGDYSPGIDPERRNYASFIDFADPDGNVLSLTQFR